MADRKISDLTALTTPASGDFLPIVDISEAALDTKNKRITIEELMRGMPDGTAAAPGIAFESDPNTGIYSPGADTLAFVEGGVEAMRIDSSGRLLVGTSTANTSGAKLQTSDGLTFPATQVASADANTLDDYEEGTWTATIVGTTTAGTATYAAQTGNYTKVGRAVSIVLYIAWSGHTGTGNMNLHGLPFTSTSGNNSAGVTIGYLNNLALTALNVFSPIIDAGQTKVDFYQSPVGGGAIATVPIDAVAAFALSCTYFV
jgi:hypothetical protein